VHLLTFYTLLVFFCLNHPAQDCYNDCESARKACAVKCSNYDCYVNCGLAWEVCSNNCPSTGDDKFIADVDVDIEGAFVDEA
jgi:hypothetical protein